MSEIIIESATRFPSIGLKKNKIFKIYHSGKEGNHSTFFFDVIKEFNLEKVKRILITIGPGRFTSLRVGLSFALGLAIPRKIKIIPLNTFDIVENKLSKKFSDFGIFLKKGGEGFLYRKKGDDKIYVVKEIKDNLPLFTFEPVKIDFEYNIIMIDPLMMYEYYIENKEKLEETIDYDKIKLLYSFLPYEKSLIEKGKIKGYS